MRFFRFLYIFLLVSSVLFVTVASYKGFKEAKKVAGVSSENSDKGVQGIVLPHHDLAREFIIRSLDKISQNQNYKNIVVIGPNHFYPLETSFITATEVSGVPLNEDLVRDLIKNTNMTENIDVLKKEHSFNLPEKYLSNYFPEASFVPILVPQNYDRDTLKLIGEYLADKLGPESLVVASTDFSHENMLIEAERRNLESIEAIKSFDYEAIYKFNSENLDSPGSIALLLHIMEKRESRNFQLLFESHGAFVEGNPELQGTSYVIGTFSGQ